MPSLDMEGPYRLDHETVCAVVTDEAAGNYALGFRDAAGEFVVWYVGRSDYDIAARLRSWVASTDCPLFKFCYAASPKAAFEKECRTYHDFQPPGNTGHPARPPLTNWKCPRCAAFGQTQEAVRGSSMESPGAPHDEQQATGSGDPGKNER